MRRYIKTDELPNRRIVVRFHFKDEGLEYDTYWIVVNPGDPVQLCTSIPGFDMDLWVETTVPSLSAIILARSTVSREIDAGRMFVSGDALLARTMQRWLYVTEYLPDEGPKELPLETSKAYAAG